MRGSFSTVPAGMGGFHTGPHGGDFSSGGAERWQGWEPGVVFAWRVEKLECAWSCRVRVETGVGKRPDFLQFRGCCHKQVFFFFILFALQMVCSE